MFGAGIRQSVGPWAALAVAMSALAGCGGGSGGTWVDSQESCTGESGAELWARIQADENKQRSSGGDVCGSAGKSYDGAWRCENSRIEVRCR